MDFDCSAIHRAEISYPSDITHVNTHEITHLQEQHNRFDLPGPLVMAACSTLDFHFNAIDSGISSFCAL